MGFNQNITNLRRYFGGDVIARRLATLAVISTTIMDLVYVNRPQHPKSILGVDDITEAAGPVPVIRRGSRSYPVDADTGGLRFIDPQPITPSSFAKANEINDLFAMGGTPALVQAWVDQKIDKLRRICRRTTEILCAQSLAGAIDYKMATEGGALVDYDVDFGTPTTLAAADWTGKGLAEMMSNLEEIYVALQDEGFAGKVRFLMGTTAYQLLTEKVLAARNVPVVFTDYGVILAGKYQIQPMGETYLKPGDVNRTAVVGAKLVCAVDTAAPHALHYCALDDLEANLQPLPFYAKPVMSDDPSGIKIIGNSKPMPAPVIKAIKWRTLVA